MQFTSLRSFISSVAMICVILATGCGTPNSTHPNQINSFDGASFDSLTLAHGALTSLRAEMVTSYPKYAPMFDQAANSYSVALNAYAAYRAAPVSQTALTVAMANLTVSIVNLENSFQTDMNVSKAQSRKLRKEAEKIRLKAEGQNITVSDILTELELAAAIAKAVPASASYASLASMVIAATSEALAEESAQAGLPIDLTVIQPLSLI